MNLELCPVTIGEARTFVDRHHRHHSAPQSGLFAVAVSTCSCEDGGHCPSSAIVGVAVIGRPIARAYQNGYTAEVTRCCVLDGYRNACSMLYGAAWRAAKALGYRRLITYTLKSESGSSLRGAGWKVIGERETRSWSEDSPGRPRVDRTAPAQRLLWEVS